jgi:putative thioredoxin
MDSNFIFEANSSNFQKNVIEASLNKPIVVDFWAPWCSPCKELMPLLEQKTNDSNGSFLLAKVNVDENPAIAGQLGIQTVPMVVAFFGGRPVDGFAGAQTSSFIDEFIKRIENLSPNNEENSINETLSNAQNLLDENNISSALPMFSKVLEVDEQNENAIVGILNCYLKLGDLETAKKFLSAIDTDLLENPKIRGITNAIELLEDSGEIEEISKLENALEQNPDNFDARFQYAKALFAGGNGEQAMNELLYIVKKDISWNEGAAKSQIIKIFEALGITNPNVIKARKILSVYAIV